MAQAPEANDVLLLVPFEPVTAHGYDPTIRQTLGARLGAPLTRAVSQFEQYLGHRLNVLQWTGHPMLDGEATALPARRSLTAVTLATHLEKHGLAWAALDPGPQALRYWRRQLARMRSRPPRVVALSTSFVVSGTWLQALCGIVRRTLPESTFVVGGSFYATSARQFLALEADVLCIGEGEERLPRIVQAIRDGRPLDAVAGLYLRSPDGSLRFTGPAEPLDLDRLDPVDWSLADRIQPPVDWQGQPASYLVETQRGCAFRCRFCTFRSVTAYQTMSPERAAEAILRTAGLPPGMIFVVDSTATFPPRRWEAVLKRLVDQGGSPHPLVVFGRVSDISEPMAELMARAGVRGVAIGQESGDQALLDRMKKGTRVEHVAPALQALARYDIGAQFCFICGYPGETDQSIRATRQMIVGLNKASPAEPVATTYILIPFNRFDLATVAQDESMRNVHHPLGYQAAAVPPQRVAEEMLATLVAASRVPHAPLCSFLFNGLVDFLFNVPSQQRRYEIFRWLKAFERGVAVFLEQNLEGKTPDKGELQQLRQTVLAHCPRPGWLRSALSRIASASRARSSRRIQAEWAAEAEQGPGRMTRTWMAFSVHRDLGRWRHTWHAWKTATYPTLGHCPRLDPESLDQLSRQLVHQFLG